MTNVNAVAARAMARAEAVDLRMMDGRIVRGVRFVERLHEQPKRAECTVAMRTAGGSTVHLADVQAVQAARGAVS